VSCALPGVDARIGNIGALRSALKPGVASGTPATCAVLQRLPDRYGDAVSKLAILGGTGAQGLGLALRFAAAGEPIVIGSRVAERAQDAASKVRAAVPAAQVEGRENLDAAAVAERIVLTLPVEGLEPFLESGAALLAGKLIIDAMVPLMVRKRVAELTPVGGAASVSELVQTRVPAARVVCAFKNVPSDALHDLAHPVASDVLLCGDDEAARREVALLVDRVPGLRSVDAGPLRLARYVEGLTALLVSLNIRHKALTSIAITGLERGRTAAGGAGKA
jgi:8-hydroxy-5-deazaflavin:NADPH oxidoreductase